MRTSALGAFGDSGEEAPGLARRGAICRNSFVLIPLATTASFAGEKLAANYLAFVQLASMRLRLRVDESTTGEAKALAQEHMKASRKAVA